MVKLTVTFQGTPIKIHRCSSGIVTIGRDPDNTICIEAKDIAPKHIVIDLAHPQGPQLMQEDDRFPVEVNGHPTDRHLLASGDTIRFGNYTLHYANDSEQTPDEPSAEELEASLQILSGKNIGRVIPLKRALTRLGNHDSVAIIARRKNGYFLSSLTGGEKIKINGDPLGNRTVRLNCGDMLEIDHNQLLFHV